MTWLSSHHSRFIGVTREKESRFFTSSPQRLLSLAIRSSEPDHLFGAWSGREIVLDPALHYPRVGQDAGERIVDLVRDHSGHLADGGHLLHLQHVLVGLRQLACLFVDPLFESAGPCRNFGLRQLQSAAHLIERLRQVANFIIRVHWNVEAEFAFGDPLGARL